MLFEEFLIKDIERLIDELGQLREQVSGSFELSNFSRAAEGHDQQLSKQARYFRNASIEQIGRTLETLNRIGRETGSDQSTDTSRYGVFLLTCLQSLQNEISDFEAGLLRAQPTRRSPTATQAQPIGQPNNPLRLVVSWMKMNIAPRMKRIMDMAWQIIANILSPTQWRLKGDIGSTVFGLENPGLEITFGA